MAAMWSRKPSCCRSPIGVSPAGTRSAARSTIKIDNRAVGPVPSSAMPTTAWSITGGQSAYRPACQHRNSQCVVLPVTRMIQSSAAESTLRKCRLPVDPQGLEAGAGLRVGGPHLRAVGRVRDQLAQGGGHPRLRTDSWLGVRGHGHQPVCSVCSHLAAFSEPMARLLQARRFRLLGSRQPALAVRQEQR